MILLFITPGKYSGVELLNCEEDIYMLTFVKILKLFSKAIAPLYNQIREARLLHICDD
jgi:hypothetical protein